MQRIAPIYHLQHISVPVQIHIGTADGAQLAQTPPEWSETLYQGLLNAGARRWNILCILTKGISSKATHGSP